MYIFVIQYEFIQTTSAIGMSLYFIDRQTKRRCLIDTNILYIFIYIYNNDTVRGKMS